MQSPQYHYYVFLPPDFIYDLQALQNLCAKVFPLGSQRKMEIIPGEDLSDLMDGEVGGGIPLAEIFLDDWCLCAAYEKGPEVNADAKNLKASFPEAASRDWLPRSNSRLEIWSEDPDLSMDFFNDVVFLLQALESEWKAFLFDCAGEQPV